MLCLDVFEHVEDYYGFLRQCSQKAEYKLFYIPLDISVVNIVTNRLSRLYDKSRHLHFFNQDTAFKTTSIATKIALLPRSLCFPISPSLTLRFLGGGMWLFLQNNGVCIHSILKNFLEDKK